VAGERSITKWLAAQKKDQKTKSRVAAAQGAIRCKKKTKRRNGGEIEEAKSRQAARKASDSKEEEAEEEKKEKEESSSDSPSESPADKGSDVTSAGEEEGD
jgi:hypothetical protein